MDDVSVPDDADIVIILREAFETDLEPIPHELSHFAIDAFAWRLIDDELATITFERLNTIREPEKLPGWLTTTATNEVRQILRHRSRQQVSLDWSAPGDPFAGLLAFAGASEGDHERELVRAESRRAVRRAFSALDEECREILTVLVLADPPMSYQQASEQLNRPVGALGPSRRRCLDKLRSSATMQEWIGEQDG